jgi:D-amino-acid dehydrogenase
MEVLVIGAGLAGVTSAWYLAQAGCKSPSSTASPARARNQLRQRRADLGQPPRTLGQPFGAGHHPALAGPRGRPAAVPLRADAAQWRWACPSCANACPAARPQHGHRQPGDYSRMSCGRCGEHGHRIRSRRAASCTCSKPAGAHLPAKLHELESARHPRRDSRPRRSGRLEPALAALRPRLAGVLHGLDDESGNAHLFCPGSHAGRGRRRALLPEQHSSVVRCHQRQDHRRARDDANRAGVLRADAVVLAAGSYSPELVRPLGIRLPIYPVKGYSITAPSSIPTGRRLSLTDESRRGVLRLGNTCGRRHGRTQRLRPEPQPAAARPSCAGWKSTCPRRRPQPG